MSVVTRAAAATLLVACGGRARSIDPPPRELVPPRPTALVPIAPCPASAVAIAGGSFERDGATVTVAPFCLDRTEVTVEAYGECVSGEGCRRAHPEVALDGVDAREQAYLSSYCNEGRRGRERHPVNCVTHAQAESYCAFRKGRLPSEDEWTWAARGRDAARTFPWGEEPPAADRMNACDADCKAAFAEAGREHRTLFDASDGFAGTAPVGSFAKGASRDGLLDMAGNVFEWTATSVDAETAVDRGGAWSNATDTSARTGERHTFKKKLRDGSLGMRCAFDVRG